MRVPGTGSARGLCADLRVGLRWRLDALLGMAFPLARREDCWGTISIFLFLISFLFIFGFGLGLERDAYSLIYI